MADGLRPFPLLSPEALKRLQSNERAQAKCCDNCGASFARRKGESDKRWARRHFCSLECYRANRQLQEKRGAPDKSGWGVCSAPGCSLIVRSAKATLCNTHYFRLRRQSELATGPIKPPCGTCGGPLNGANQSKFCSVECRNKHFQGTLKRRLTHADWRHRERARSLGVPFEPKVDLLAAIERDNWCCYICGQPIDPLVRRPSRLCLSIDHEHALANGGGHTFANCRAAHLGCNFEKAWSADNPASAKSRRLQGKTGQYARRKRRGFSLIKSRKKRPMAAVEKSDTAKGDRMAVDLTRKLLSPGDDRLSVAPKKLGWSGGFRKHKTLVRGVDGKVRERR